MRVAVVGASGYAGGELLRLVSGHPDLELAVATADSSAGKAVADLHPNLAGHPALANLIFEPHSAVKEADADLVFLALPSGQSAPVAASLADDVTVVDLGPDFRLADPADWARHYGGDHPGRWVTGLPELPGARPLIRGARRVAAPGCYATAAILALAPLVGGRPGRRRRCRRGRRVGNLRRRPVAAGRPARQRGDGLGLGVPGGRRAPAHARDRAGAGRGGGRSPGPRCRSRPMLAPMPRGILATCTARLIPAADRAPPTLRAALADAYAGEPFVAVLPDGRWPATAAVAGSNGVHVQAAADPRTGRATVVDRHRQPRQGRRRPGDPERQSDARPAGDSGPDLDRSSAMSVTGPLGFRAAGVAAGIKASGNPDVAVVINDGPVGGGRGRLHLEPGQGRAGPVEPAGRSRAARSARSCSTRAAPTPAPGRTGTPTPTQTAEHLAKLLSVPAGEIAVCSTGLIGERLPMHRLLVGVDAAAASASAAGGQAAATAIMTTDTVPKTCTVQGGGYQIGGMAKGAAMLAPALATMLVVLTTDADLTASELDKALRGSVRTTFDRLDSDGCMSTNDTVLLLASGASRPAARPGRVHRAADGRLRRPGPPAACSTPRARPRRSPIEVTGAASEDDAVEVGRAIARCNLFKCADRRRGPELGPGARGGRHHQRRVRAGRAQRRDQRGLGLPGRRPGDRPVGGRPAAAGRDRSRSTCRRARPRATILTTDLTAAYVHENSAYST